MRHQFSYRSRENGTRTRWRLFFVTVLALVVIAVDALTGGMVRSGARSLAASVSVFGSRIASSVTDTAYFSTRRSLGAEIASLREQLGLYRERAALYESLRRENETLRALAHVATGTPGITAPVVSSFRASPYGTFLIGAGTGDGLRAGALVLTGSGFALARITEAGVETSAARTFFATGEETDALIGEVAAVVSGRGGGNAVAYVPRAAAVGVGSVVLAPAYGGRPIGVVGRVESDPANAEQTVYISLPVNLASIQYVYVVTTGI